MLCSQKAAAAHVLRSAPRRTRGRVGTRPQTAAQAGNYDPVEELLTWAKKDGLKLSPKVAVQTLPSGLRGIVATANMPEGHIIVDLPASCTAFSAESSRDVGSELGVGAAIAKYEASASEKLSDEAVLALYLAASAQSAVGESDLGPYARSLPQDASDPAPTWDADSIFGVLPYVTASNAMAQQEAIEADLQAASGAAAHLPKPPAPDRLAWALSHVRSRALRFQVQKADTGEAVFSKCLVPVVDMMNHAGAALTRVPLMHAGDLKVAGPAGAAHEAGGPSVRVEFDGGGARWLAERTVRSGEELLWSYGSLSNSDLFLQYGFVPTAPLHGDARVEFTLPGFLFEQSLQALSGECADDVVKEKTRMLRALSVIGLQEGEEVLIELRPYEVPPLLMAVAGVLVATTKEELALFAVPGISPTAMVENRADPAAIENDRKASGFLEWFLGRIEVQLLGPPGALDDAIAAAAAAGAAQVSAPSLEAPGSFVALSRGRAEAASGLRKAEQMVFESVKALLKKEPQPVDRSIVAGALQAAGGGEGSPSFLGSAGGVHTA